MASEVNHLENRVDRLEENLAENVSLIDQRVRFCEQQNTKLHYVLITLGVLLVALYAVVIIYLVRA